MNFIYLSNVSCFNLKFSSFRLFFKVKSDSKSTKTSLGHCYVSKTPTNLSNLEPPEFCPYK